METGEYIKSLRTKKGISQEELGKVVGVQRAAVQKWEAGKVQNLKRSTIKKLADYFKVSPISFIDDDNSMFNNINLSFHEKEVITAYRNHPEMQSAVDRLLDVQENTIKLKAVSRSTDNQFPSEIELTKEKLEEIKNAPPFDKDI